MFFSVTGAAGFRVFASPFIKVELASASPGMTGLDRFAQLLASTFAIDKLGAMANPLPPGERKI
jgi:hypothetical protein